MLLWGETEGQGGRCRPDQHLPWIGSERARNEEVAQARVQDAVHSLQQSSIDNRRL